jgi:hypothetical protein
MVREAVHPNRRVVRMLAVDSNLYYINGKEYRSARNMVVGTGWNVKNGELRKERKSSSPVAVICGVSCKKTVDTKFPLDT